MLVFLFTSVNVQAQFLKEFYEDFLKYGTVYAAGDIQNAYESSRKEYFVERPEDGNIYDIPRVVEVTEYYHSIIELDLVFVNLVDLIMKGNQVTFDR